MKGTWTFWLLAVVLVSAMALTLMKGGNRSRHGYGLTPPFSPSTVPEYQRSTADQGGPWRTG